MTIASTSPAVPNGLTNGPSQAKPEKPATCSEVTTTGRETVPLGTSDFPRSVLMSSIVSWSFSTDPPLLAPRTSAIFARMLVR